MAAGYETGSNLNHCVKAIFFSQNQRHDGSLSKRLDRNPDQRLSGFDLASFERSSLIMTFGNLAAISRR